MNKAPATGSLLARAGGLIAVWLDVEPGHEEEFSAWYKYEHLRQVVELKGFLSGRRYLADYLFPRFLALYETEDESAEDVLLEMMKTPTPWSLRIRTMYGENRKRNNYRRIAYASHTEQPYGGALVLIQGDAPAGTEDAVERWMKHNAGQALKVPGCNSARYFLTSSGSPRFLELYDFADATATGSAAWYRFLTGDVRRQLATTLNNVVQQRYLSMGTSYVRTI